MRYAVLNLGNNTEIEQEALGYREEGATGSAGQRVSDVGKG